MVDGKTEKLFDFKIIILNIMNTWRSETIQTEIQVEFCRIHGSEQKLYLKEHGF